MLKRNIKTIWGVLSVLVLLVLTQNETVLGIPTVFAQNTAGANLGDTMVNLVSQLAWLNIFMHFLLLLALDFIGFFLRADFLTNPQMMGALNQIWVLSRDLMNIIFALMLVGVAFYTIITAKKEFIMSKISTFVIAVILVNFSWFFPRVIIDVANVLTATVYSIPQMLPGFSCMQIDSTNNNANINVTYVPCRVLTSKRIFGTRAEQTAWWTANSCQGAFNTVAPAAAPVYCKCTDGIGCYKTETYQNAVTSGRMTGGHAMVNALAVSFMKLTEMTTVPTTLTQNGGGGGNAAAVGAVSFKVGMSVLMTLLVQMSIVLPLFALGIGLLVRMVLLWICIAFMPFTFLGYVVNGKLGTNVFGFEIDIWQEFINAAFLPATVAIPITVGLIMVTTGVRIPPVSVPFSSDWQEVVPLLSGVKTWWSLLWMFAAIVIIWTGAFKALSKSQFVGKFTEKIRGFGEGLATNFAKLPLLTPIPLPGNRSMRLGQLTNTPRALSQAVSQAASGDNRPFMQILNERLNPRGNTTNPQQIQAANTALQPHINDLNRHVAALNAPGATPAASADALREIRNILRDRGRLETVSDRHALELLHQMAQAPNANNALRSNLPNITTARDRLPH